MGAWPGTRPGFAHPLLCPSVLHEVELERLPDVEAFFRLPCVHQTEPWVYDSSLVLTPSLKLDGDAVVDAPEDERADPERRRPPTR